MNHKHHIIPKHMGGTDDPSNIQELTIEEHAEAHRILYDKYGLEEDKIAWLGLTGLISKTEVMLELHKLGRKKTDQILFEKYGVTNPSQIPSVKYKMSQSLKKRHAQGNMYIPDWTGRKHKEESIERMKLSAIGKHDGEKNSQYGTMWITNGSESKKIRKEEIIPEGWYKGRKK